MHRLAGKKVFRATWIPSGQIDSRAVLESVANRVQHIRLNPKWVARFASPDA
jgi:hypothetical protein